MVLHQCRICFISLPQPASSCAFALIIFIDATWRAQLIFCFCLLLIFFCSQSSSLSRPSRDHPHSPIARVRANLFCPIQRALILPLTLTSFSLPAAEVALIVAPSRSVDCGAVKVAVIVVPSRSRAQLIVALSRLHAQFISRRRGRAIPLSPRR